MRIVARPRVHVALADMGFASARAYGGVGFTIDQPCTTIEVQEASEIRMEGFESLDARLRRHLEVAVKTVLRISERPGVSVKLRSSAPQHSGFGTTTTVSLALIRGIDS